MRRGGGRQRGIGVEPGHAQEECRAAECTQWDRRLRPNIRWCSSVTFAQHSHALSRVVSIAYRGSIRADQKSRLRVARTRSGDGVIRRPQADLIHARYSRSILGRNRNRARRRVQCLIHASNTSSLEAARGLRRFAPEHACICDFGLRRGACMSVGLRHSGRSGGWLASTRRHHDRLRQRYST